MTTFFGKNPPENQGHCFGMSAGPSGEMAAPSLKLHLVWGLERVVHVGVILLWERNGTVSSLILNQNSKLRAYFKTNPWNLKKKLNFL